MHTIAGAHKPGCVRYMHTTQNTVATHPLFICINWNQMTYKPWHNKTVWVWMVQSDTSWVMRLFFNFPLQSLWKPWSCSYKLNIRPMTSCLTWKLLKSGLGWSFFSTSRSKFTESHMQISASAKAKSFHVHKWYFSLTDFLPWLAGCFLGAFYMLPGCFLGAFWVLPGCFLI